MAYSCLLNILPAKYANPTDACSLVMLLDAYARERGDCKLTLEVPSGKGSARRLYERVGFAGYQLDPALGQAQFLPKVAGVNLRPPRHPRKTRNKGSRAAVALALGAAFLAGASLARAGDAVPAAATPFKLTTGLYSMSGGGAPAGLGLDLNLRYTSGLGDLWLGWFRAPVLDVAQPRAGWHRTYDFGGVRFMPSLQVVRDNRQNPSQQNVHLLYRTPVADQRLLTLDLLAKTGLLNGVPIHRLGLSVTYDWRQNFVRLAYDPRVNFTPQDMWRLSVGSRF